MVVGPATPVLLAAGLVIPLLDVDTFHGDETASLLAAGIQRTGSWSILDVWENTAPRHPPGWAILLSIWGRLVGWSEFAIRALSLFIGLLTLAWVYRAGRDLLAPAAGLIATLLLSASVFHLAFMTRAELYAPVALWTVMCIWFYLRVALYQLEPGRGAQAGLLLSSIGLLYSHYLGALFLPALGLFHLLYVPKHRRWWRPVVLFGFAILVAALQIPLIPRGVAFTEDENLRGSFLAAPAFLSHLLSYMTNGLVNLSPSLALLLYVGWTLALVIITLRFLRSGKRAGAVWLLVFTSATLISLVIAINEALKIMTASRIRYIMPLWPLTALLVGAAFWRLARSFRRPASVLLALWLISGAWLTVATDYRYELGYFFHREYHEIYPVLRKLVPRSDLLVFDHSAADYNLGLDYVTKFFYNYKSDPYQ